MTTGRINQVTILDSSAAQLGDRAREPPKRGQNMLQEGAHHKGSPSQRQATRKARSRPTSYPFAPTEFPKERSTTEGNRAQRPPYTAAYTPQMEGTCPQVNARKRILVKAFPQKDLEDGSKKPSIHKIHSVPTSQKGE